MKNILFIWLSLQLINCGAQGFPALPSNFTAPIGGKITGGITFGYNSLGGTAFASDNTGSQTWSCADMNGDDRPDLIITAQLQGGNVTSFAPGSNQYWKVFFNNGSGFSSTATNWSLPNGGKLTGGITYGYDNVSGFAAPSDNTGAQNWIMTDMDGDGKPDLVVTAQLQAGNVTSFAPGSSQYWKVYLNNGSGFSTTPINWAFPNGGKLTGSINYGFNTSAGIASSTDDTGSQTWSVIDLTGDSKPDLVILAQLQGGNVTSFSPSSNQYWKVYANTGNGFNTTPVNWSMSIGGKLVGGINYGIENLYGYASSTDNTGSQSWAVTDMDGDKKPDLVITAQLQGGNVTSFAPTSGQYWKVYSNTGSGFSTNPVNFSLPTGGKLQSGINYGYDHLGGNATSFDNTGSQNWSLADLDLDQKPELIVTAQLQAGNVTCFAPGTSPYWKVYKNNGNNFSASPINWSLPLGGKLSGGVTYGFQNLGGNAFSSDDTGSQTWAVTDLNGDNVPDLVVVAQLQAGEVTLFSPGSSQYWKVYSSSGALGLNQYSAGPSQANLFPNPNNGTFTIRGYKAERVNVYEETGRLVKFIELKPEDNFESELTLPCKGIYFLRSESFQFKVIYH